jgi:hypothetical protein
MILGTMSDTIGRLRRSVKAVPGGGGGMLPRPLMLNVPIIGYAFTPSIKNMVEKTEIGTTSDLLMPPLATIPLTNPETAQDAKIRGNINAEPKMRKTIDNIGPKVTPITGLNQSTTI